MRQPDNVTTWRATPHPLRRLEDRYELQRCETGSVNPSNGPQPWFWAHAATAAVRAKVTEAQPALLIGGAGTTKPVYFAIHSFRELRRVLLVPLRAPSFPVRKPRCYSRSRNHDITITLLESYMLGKPHVGPGPRLRPTPWCQQCLQ
jgi:hypothetical protein